MKPPLILSALAGKQRRYSQALLHQTLVALLRGIEEGKRVDDIPDTPLDEFAQGIERLIDATGIDTGA
jgi:hypothetical protein